MRTVNLPTSFLSLTFPYQNPQAKPWGELVDRSSFSKPANMAEATGRLRQNVNYFRTNYLIMATGTTALVMFMNPWSLIVLAFLAVIWFYMYIIKTTPLVIGGREFGDREKFMMMAGGSLVVIFFLTSVGSIIFYALGLSMLVIGGHAMLHQPDDLFIDEVPAQNGGGLFSFFNRSASQAAYQAVAAS